jgi:thioesterase domain-containing protein
VGHSLGGLIALEAAQLLARRGREVPLVVVLDTFLPPRYGGYIGEWSRRRESAASAAARDVEPLPDEQPRAGLPLLLHAMREQDPAMLKQRLLLPFASVLRFGPQLTDAVFRQHGLWLSRTAKVGTWPGRTLVIYTDENPDDLDNWDLLLTGEHEVRRVEGSHTGILRPPYLAEVMRHIRVAVDEAVGAPAGPAQPRGAAPG